MRSRNLIRPGVYGSLVTLLIACNRDPAPVAVPQVSPQAAGKQAVADYDQNADGVLSVDELSAAPALHANFLRLDTDKDGKLTAEEITTRVQAWHDIGLGMLAVPVTVTLDAAPLADATVTFVPESFLGSAYKSGSGVTKPSGETTVTLAEGDRPDTGVTGMPPGFYTVKISKFVSGKESLSAQYNTTSVLGVEVRLDQENSAGRYVFDLVSDE